MLATANTGKISGEVLEKMQVNGATLRILEKQRKRKRTKERKTERKKKKRKKSEREKQIFLAVGRTCKAIIRLAQELEKENL